MTVKRTPDPAGLLGDKVAIDLTDPQPEDFEALRALLSASSPAARIAALRRHETLVETADRLAQRLRDLGGSADLQLLAEIACAETRVLYVRAAPQVMRDRARQAGTRRERRPEVTRWIRARLTSHPGEQVAEMWEAAPQFITDVIGRDRFRKRVAAARKRRK